MWNFNTEIGLLTVLHKQIDPQLLNTLVTLMSVILKGAARVTIS